MNLSGIIPAVVSAIVSLIGLIIVYVQNKKNTENKIKELRKQFAADLIKSRIGPYSEFMKQLEKTSSINKDEILKNPEVKKEIMNLFHEAIYGPIGILASHTTRYLLVESRKATFEFIEGKIDYDGWRKYPWIIALSLRNDLGIDQPGWENEIDLILGKEKNSDDTKSSHLDRSRWLNQPEKE